MDWNTSNNNSSPPPPQEEMTWHQFFSKLALLFGFAGVVWFNKNQATIERWYIMNYESVWLGALGILALGIVALTYWLTRRDVHLVKRIKALSPFGYGDIHVGLTKDGLPVTIDDDQRKHHVLSLIHI